MPLQLSTQICGLVRMRLLLTSKKVLIKIIRFLKLLDAAFLLEAFLLEIAASHCNRVRYFEAFHIYLQCLASTKRSHILKVCETF